MAHKSTSFISHPHPFNRHPREGGDPAFFNTANAAKSWTPAFAGVTNLILGQYIS
jgi:hypothetical protein